MAFSQETYPVYRTVLVHAILNTARLQSVVYPKEFLHLGTRAAIDQTFSRLVRANHIIRLARGIYRRRSDDPLGEPRFRTPQLVQALEAQGGCELLPGGASEARTLGLTDEVPKRDVYVRAGRNRKPINSEWRFLEIRSAPRWQLALGKRPAGAAARALAWLGPDQSRDTLRKLIGILPSEELKALFSLRSLVPRWLAVEMSIVRGVG
jgi:hypothetical protein